MHHAICTICHYRNVKIKIITDINPLSTVEKLHVQQPGECTVLHRRLWIRLHLLRRLFKGEVLLLTSCFCAVLPLIAPETAVWHLNFLYWCTVHFPDSLRLALYLEMHFKLLWNGQKYKESLENVSNFAKRIKWRMTVSQRMLKVHLQIILAGESAFYVTDFQSTNSLYL